MIRNPFDSEGNAIADFKTRSRIKKAERELKAPPAGLPEALPDSAPSEPGPRDAPYFGQGEELKVGIPFLPDKTTPSDPDKPTSPESPVPAPPVPLSRKETVPVPRPSATGAVCYRCNGKGRHLTSLAADARMIQCADCAGTGRR